MKKETIIKGAIVIAIFTATSLTSNAQGNPGGPGSNGSGTYGNGNPVGGPNVPFDGGMSLILIGGGVRYGVKKLKKK